MSKINLNINEVNEGFPARHSTKKLNNSEFMKLKDFTATKFHFANQKFINCNYLFNLFHYRIRNEHLN